MKPNRLLFLTLALFAGALALAPVPAAQDARRVSAFGRYAGYGVARYDDYVRESFYIPMRDGVELACDLYRPTKDGDVAEEALPLVWTHDRYHRAAQAGDTGAPTKLMAYSWLQTLLHDGYLVAAVDVRGAGASFGTWQGIFNEEETRDAHDLVEWFADQEWCDGNIGMYGGSYLGGTQLMAASTKPPHLKAIFPWVAPGDLYEIGWSGGIYRDDLCRIWGDLTRMLDHSPEVASVEWDDGGELKAEAQAEHDGNRPFESVVSKLPYRDSPYQGRSLWEVESPITHLPAIQESGVAIYFQGGWFDPFVRDALVMYSDLKNPEKLVIGPWFHSQSFGVDWNAEAVRWFDHWLKGVENGVMDEEPIHYYTMGAPEGQEWRASKTWPLENEKRVAYYFHAGPSGSIESANDGLLAPGPVSGEGKDTFTVDYAASSGPITRWSNAVGQGGRNPAYEDQRENDARGLTYTTPALAADLEVTGHPVAHLWVSVDATDGDLFVYLEEVLPDGTSQYVTEGCLRASCRALGDPPHGFLGLPYHPCTEDSLLPVTAEPMELVFDLFPTSNVFDAGHRIRVSIAGADDENALTPPVDPRPTTSVLRGEAHPSYVELPVIPLAKSTQTGARR